MSPDPNFQRRAKIDIGGFGVSSIELVDVRANGMVFRSSQPFEMGMTLSMGCHFRIRPQDGRSPGGVFFDGEAMSDSFFDFSGTVVDCQPAGSQYEVTLLFDKMKEEDCALLIEAARHRSDLDAPFPGWREFGEPIDLDGFERIYGLN